MLRKPDINLLRKSEVFFGAAQEAERGKAAHGQHTYCITPAISMLSPHPFRKRQPATESESQPERS